MNPLVWATDSIKRRGLLRTSQVASSSVRDLFFDWRYGTETRRWVEADEFDTSSENKAHAVFYAATKARPFLKLLGELSFPTGSVFVDLGSGKGRVLLLAAQWPFQRVVGVEFCPSLCGQARENVATFTRVAALSAPIEIIEADVTTCAVGDDANVFYLYNPFNAPVMAQVLDNIQRSVARSPRPLCMIYNTPLHHEVVLASGLFREFEGREIGGTEFRIYRS